MNIEICQTDLFNPALMTLIAQLDAYQLPRYPAESNYADPVEVMLQVKTLVYIANVNNQAVGCAALVLPEGRYPEVKRIFFIPEYRGLGIAKLLITTVIDQSNELNLNDIYLETGVYQPEAIKLYQCFGFKFTSVFGHYQYDPLSLYMVKSLDGDS
ncbi:GNAT family N-acetyltransferase [Yersinia aldovae]|uniref:GNAT family N-acetyltransferase n=1 Tax=Yersinia aldovae TaxID=29483 RepID=UPI0005AD2A19|nr:GNAT family N-acetyltransferase [Yersinia aldovae]AJJ61324.1 acetyltransferase domain protein [Yersinia aldovae 670-83]